jgi:hypothetical protein
MPKIEDSNHFKKKLGKGQEAGNLISTVAEFLTFQF